ncbi:MAG: hypothetical protein HXN53_05475, partial [Prevotella nigrescens]|nr:hypothetical protein [Prevotella nigrescens]
QREFNEFISVQFIHASSIGEQSFVASEQLCLSELRSGICRNPEATIAVTPKR